LQLLQGIFIPSVHAHAGRTEVIAASPYGLDALTRAAALGVIADPSMSPLDTEVGQVMG